MEVEIIKKLDSLKQIIQAEITSYEEFQIKKEKLLRISQRDDIMKLARKSISLILCFFIIKPLYKAIKSLFKMMIEPFSQERNEATLVRSGITAFPYVLPLAGYFLSVADTLLLVLLVCFCHPSVVHLPLGRAITASLTLMLLSLVVPRLATSLVLV